LEIHIFLAVILAALLHASWNLIVKLNLDRFLSIFLLQCFLGLAATERPGAWPSP
jgi:hypothetical protein